MHRLHLNILGIPEAERQESWHYTTSILPMPDMYATHFEAALSLFSTSHQQIRALNKIICEPPSPAPDPQKSARRQQASRGQSMFIEWSKIAARDAAMTVYHFGEALDAIMKGIKKCPTLDGLVDRTLLNQVQPLFEQNFKKATRIRNSVAHSAEISATTQKVQKNAFTGDFDNGAIKIENSTVIMNNVGTDTGLLMTFMGDMLPVSVTPEKLAQLIEIGDLVHAAFRNAEQELDERARLDALNARQKGVGSAA